MTLRVLFLGTLSPDRPTIIGRAVPLARELRKRGHDAEISTLGHTNATKTIQGMPISVVGPSLRDNNTPRPSIPRIASRLRNGTRALSKALVAKPYDIVILVKPHPQNMYAIRGTQLPVVLDTDDDEVWGSRLAAPERLVMRVVERSAARHARLITACSPALVKKYMRISPKTPVECIPTSIEKDEGEGVPNIRTELSIPPSAPIIMYIGSIAIQSGHRVDHLIDIWNEIEKNIPDARLVIAGDGIDYERIKLRASPYSRIHFLGRFSPSHAIPLVRQATVLVDPADHSSQAEAKSSSRTLYALATGIPIVAAKGGIRDVILPRSLHSRFLYDPANLSTLPGRIRNAVLPETADIFRQETSGLWERWSWDTIGKQFCSLIEDIA